MAKTFSEQARLAGAKARDANRALRVKLAKKHGLKVSDFSRGNIAATIMQHGIAVQDVPGGLIPEGPITKKKFESLPLDSPVFDRPEKKKYAKKVKAAPNREMLERVLSLLEKLV